MKVHFLVVNGDILTEYSQKQLDKVINILKKEPTFKLILKPSVDVVGNEYNNKKLYNLRGRTIKEYLTEKGIPQARLSIQEFSSSNTAKINNLAKSDINRRGVEFWVSK